MPPRRNPTSSKTEQNDIYIFDVTGQKYLINEVLMTKVFARILQKCATLSEIGEGR